MTRNPLPIEVAFLNSSLPYRTPKMPFRGVSTSNIQLRKSENIEIEILNSGPWSEEYGANVHSVWWVVGIKNDFIEKRILIWSWESFHVRRKCKKAVNHVIDCVLCSTWLTLNLNHLFSVGLEGAGDWWEAARQKFIWELRIKRFKKLTWTVIQWNGASHSFQWMKEFMNYEDISQVRHART